MARLTPELEEAIRQVMVEKTAPRGTILRGAANIASYACYIAEGAARVCYVDRGREHTVSFAFTDQFVALSRRLLQEHPDTIAIHFLADTRCIYFPPLRVIDMLEDAGAVNDTAAALFFNAAILNVVKDLDERLMVMQSYSARKRLAWLTRRYPRILEMATLTQIASYLGLSKETLYRIRGGKYPAGDDHRQQQSTPTHSHDSQ